MLVEQRGRSPVELVGASVDVGEFFRDAAQFREVEMVLGLRDPAAVRRAETDGTRERLRRRLEAPSLWDATLEHLARTGHPVDPADEADETLQRLEVRRAVEALQEPDRRVLELRFGFTGEQWTLEAIGKELGLTRERVRQIESRALTRLQHQLKDVVRAEGADVVLAA